MTVTNCTVGSDSTLNEVDALAFRDPTDTEMTPKKIVLLSVMTTSNVFMLLGNSFSIYIILCSRSLRRHTYYWLVLNLAVLDLLNSSFVVPINIVWEFHGNWPFSQILCDIEIFCDLGFSTVAAYSTVLLSLDKYLYITKPFFYHTHVGPKWTIAGILATWVVWMTYSGASVFGELARSTKEYKYAFPLDNCNFVLRHVYAITSFVLVFFIPLLILVFTSSRILYVARQHLKKIHHNHRVSDATTSSLDLSAVSPATNTAHNASDDTHTSRLSSSHASESPPENSNSIISKNSLEVPAVLNQSKNPTTVKAGCFGRKQTDEGSRKVNKVCTSSFRAFGTVTLVVFAYIVMFAPYWIASVVNLGCLCIQPMIFEDYLAVLYYMHSLVNPYIYMATDRRYKKAIRVLTARWKCCRPCRRRRMSAVVHISSVHL